MASGSAYVIFRLGDEEFGLPVDVVSGIIRYEPATPVPRAPEVVLGVINLRGRVVPIVDLRRRFRNESFVPQPSSRIIVAEGEAGPVGIAVDAANEVTTIDDDELRPVPEGVLGPETARAFSAVVERDDKLVILLDLDEAIPRAEYASAAHDSDTGSGGLDV